MKTTLIYALIFFLAASCLKEGSNSSYTKKTDRVDIIATYVPDTATNLEQVHISARAAAENGCWSNLYFKLISDSEFEYTLEAYGTYESSGICPDMMVYKDTTIAFQPMQKGTFLFHITHVPYEEEVDTMIVK
jgi:hypothetical protein